MVFEIFLFIIYNSYYKNGEYKNDDPLSTIWGILTASTFFAIMGTAFSLYILFSHKEIDYDSLKGTIMIVAGLYGAALYWYLNRNINIIYEKHKNDTLPTYWKWISWLIILMFFLIGLSPAYIKLLRI